MIRAEIYGRLAQVVVTVHILSAPGLPRKHDIGTVVYSLVLYTYWCS